MAAPDRTGRGPFDVTANLSVTVDGTTVDIVGYGDLLVVDAPTVRAALDLVQRVRRRSLGDVGEVLTNADVAVDVRVRGASVARLGPRTSPGVVSRWLGAAPARLSLGGVTLAAVRR